MKFNLRTGNYAKAGKAAADDAVRSQIAARKHSADFGKMAQQAQVIRSEVKTEGIKAATKVATAGIKAHADVKTTKMKVDAEEQYKKDKRFAGVVSAAGGVVSKGLIGLGEKPAERRDSSEMLDFYRDKEQEYRDKATEIRGRTYDDITPPLTDTDNTGSSSAGKDVSAEVPNTSADTTVATASTRSSKPGGSVAMRLMSDLTADGYSPVQAAAIVGNAQHESANFTAHEEFTPNSYGTRGAGFFQWTNAGGSNRRDNFEGYARQHGLDPTSYEANTGFMMHELKGGAGNHWTGGMNDNSFRQINDLGTAVTSFQNNYLRPHRDHAHTDRRMQNAQQILQEYNSRQG